MKGTTFQKPLELKLNIQGETWRQGDPIHGTLSVKNHGASDVALDGLKVVLAYGTTSKVRQKSDKAFDPVSSTELGAGAKLAAGQEQTFEWTFQTDRNCPITEKSGSLYVLYGQAQALEALGQLQLQLQPYWVIEEFLKVLTIRFRFVLKSMRSTAQDYVEAKLSPPSSSAFAAVENLLASFKFEGDQLEVQYVINAKKIEASPGAMDLKKKKLTFEQLHEKAQYLMPSGRFNDEAMEAAVRDVLGQLGLGTFT